MECFEAAARVFPKLPTMISAFNMRLKLGGKHIQVQPCRWLVLARLVMLCFPRLFCIGQVCVCGYNSLLRTPLAQNEKELATKKLAECSAQVKPEVLELLNNDAIADEAARAYFRAAVEAQERRTYSSDLGVD